jgi:hypothetical protein
VQTIDATTERLEGRPQRAKNPLNISLELPQFSIGAIQMNLKGAFLALSLISGLWSLVSVSSAQVPIGKVQVSGSHLQDSSGNPISNATISFAPVSARGGPLSYQINGVGHAMFTPITTSVTSGAFTILLADTVLTNPANICFNVTVTDNATGNQLLGPGYSCYQPAGSGAVVTGGQCTAAGVAGGTCNFDLYTPNLAPQALVQTGPQGPAGIGSDSSCHADGSGHLSCVTVTTTTAVLGAVNNIVMADQQPGATADAKINACIGLLLSTGGICDARGIQGAQTIAATVTLGNQAGTTPVLLLLGNATYGGTANPMFRLYAYSELRGVLGTTIKPTSTNTAVLLSGTAGGYTSTQWGGIKGDLTINCNNTGLVGVELDDTGWIDVEAFITGCETAGVKLAGSVGNQNTYINSQIYNNPGIGVWGATAQNNGIHIGTAKKSGIHANAGGGILWYGGTANDFEGELEGNGSYGSYTASGTALTWNAAQSGPNTNSNQQFNPNWPANTSISLNGRLCNVATWNSATSATLTTSGCGATASPAPFAYGNEATLANGIVASKIFGDFEKSSAWNSAYCGIQLGGAVDGPSLGGNVLGLAVGGSFYAKGNVGNGLCGSPAVYGFGINVDGALFSQQNVAISPGGAVMRIGQVAFSGVTTKVTQPSAASSTTNAGSVLRDCSTAANPALCAAVNGNSNAPIAVTAALNSGSTATTGTVGENDSKVATNAQVANASPSTVNGVGYGASPATNTVPVVTAPNTTTYEAIPNTALAHSSTTVNGQTCTLGGTCSITFGAGTIPTCAAVTTIDTICMSEVTGVNLLATNSGSQPTIFTTTSGIGTFHPLKGEVEVTAFTAGTALTGTMTFGIGTSADGYDESGLFTVTAAHFDSYANLGVGVYYSQPASWIGSTFGAGHTIATSTAVALNISAVFRGPSVMTGKFRIWGFYE